MWVAYSNRGFGHEQNKDYGKAIADYTYVIEVSRFERKSGKFLDYQGRGRSYSNRAAETYTESDIDNAIADWRKVLEIQPSNHEASAHIAWMERLRLKAKTLAVPN